MKPCALCTSRIEKMSGDEKHPLFLARSTEPRSSQELVHMSQQLNDSFPDNFRFIVADSTVDFEKLDDARLAELGLKRIEKRKEEEKK